MTITDRLRFAPLLRRRDETGEPVALACTAAGDFSVLMKRFMPIGGMSKNGGSVVSASR